MKKSILLCLFCLLSSVMVFTGCDDDKYYRGDYESELNNIYSNKNSSQPNAGALELSYSGSMLYGKDAYFTMTSGSTARIVLHDVLPGERKGEIRDIALQPAAGGYQFQGTGASQKGTKLKYTGTIVEGELKLSLYDIRVSSNPLTDKGTWRMVEGAYSEYNEDNGNPLTDDVKDKRFCAFLRIESSDPELEMLINMLGQMIERPIHNIMYLLLEDVTFHPDGNITVTYADGLGDDFLDKLLGQYLMGFATPADRQATYRSPMNIVKYYIDGESVRVVPDLYMIMRLIEASGIDLDLELEISGGSLEAWLPIISEVYKAANQWATTGLRLSFRKNDLSYKVSTGQGNNAYDYIYRYQGDYILSLQGPEIEFVKNILKVLPDVLSQDILDIMIGDGDEDEKIRLGDLLETVNGLLDGITRFELGLLLYEDN